MYSEVGNEPPVKPIGRRWTVQKWAISHGNLIDGFELFGVFDSPIDAMAWAEKKDKELSMGWHVIAIEVVTEASQR